MRWCVAALPQAITSESAIGGSSTHFRQLINTTYNFTRQNYAMKAHLREMLPAVALRKAEISDS